MIASGIESGKGKNKEIFLRHRLSPDSSRTYTVNISNLFQAQPITSKSVNPGSLSIERPDKHH